MGIVWKRSIFLNRNATVRFLRDCDLILKKPYRHILQGDVAAHWSCPCSELTVANNLWQLLFYKLTNYSNSICVQYYKLLNLRYFSGILRQLKLSKLNSAFNHLIFFPTKFTIRTKEEELYTCFMIEIIMIIIKKTQKWESKGSPGIEKFLLTSLVSMFLRVSKWPWAVIFYKNRFQS